MQPEGFDRVHKKWCLVRIPRQINPVHAIISCFFFYISQVFDECRTYDQPLVWMILSNFFCMWNKPGQNYDGSILYVADKIDEFP